MREGNEGKGDESFAAKAGILLDQSSKGGFQRGLLYGDADGAGGNFLLGGALETELTDAEAVLILGIRRQRWAEGAAGQRTAGVQIAQAGGGIENGAKLIVGEILESCSAGGVEKTSARVAREIGAEAGDGCAAAGADSLGALRIRVVQSRETGTEPGGIELGDGEDADAALSASGGTAEMRAGAASGVSDSGIDDLNEVGVVRREHADRVAEMGQCFPNEAFFILETYSAQRRPAAGIWG